MPAGHRLYARPDPRSVLPWRVWEMKSSLTTSPKGWRACGVWRADSLGGSRASGTSEPDSDWDFAVYYRGRFDPSDLGELGWPGEVSAIGGWGGGVFNGGAWLRGDNRQVDVHYRDLDDVEHRIAEARDGC